MKTKLLIIGLALLLTNCGYNSLQGLDEDVKAAAAEIDNQLQRRSDLIPNLVATVQGYAKHEKETLQAVISARAEATKVHLDANTLKNPEAFAKFEKAQGNLSSALSRLLVVAENYPQLKANDNFRDLQSQLEGTENRIAVARKRFIDQVADFNKQVRFFPTNLTAKYLLKMEAKPTFTSAPETKVAPKVQF